MRSRKSPFGRLTPEITEEARIILRRVGLALIVFGMLDIAVMIYCIANAVSYSSSFNVFAVLAGAQRPPRAHASDDEYLTALNLH
jgi:hypothetical protein